MEKEAEEGQRKALSTKYKELDQLIRDKKMKREFKKKLPLKPSFIKASRTFWLAEGTK